MASHVDTPLYFAGVQEALEHPSQPTYGEGIDVCSAPDECARRRVQHMASHVHTPLYFARMQETREHHSQPTYGEGIDVVVDQADIILLRQ